MKWLLTSCVHNALEAKWADTHTEREREQDRSSAAKRAVPNYCHCNEKCEGRCKRAKVRVSCSFSGAQTALLFSAGSPTVNNMQHNDVDSRDRSRALLKHVVISTADMFLCPGSSPATWLQKAFSVPQKMFRFDLQCSYYYKGLISLKNNFLKREWRQTNCVCWSQLFVYIATPTASSCFMRVHVAFPWLFHDGEPFLSQCRATKLNSVGFTSPGC